MEGVNMETKVIGNGITVDSDAMRGIVKREGKTVKTFSGETAWSDAERYAMDLWFASNR
jgi:hypothetical protein